MRKKLEFLPTTFPVILSGMALPIISKIDYNLEYSTLLFVLYSPGTCFKSVKCIQNSLGSAPIIMFSLWLKEGKIFHQEGLRALYTLISHSEATKTLICVFLPF